jgi:anti-sigma B factor antagonist
MDLKVSSAALDGTGILVVSVEGELDLATAEQLQAPTEVARDADCALLLDLSACSFIDSTGLRTVLQAYRALGAGGDELVVVTGRDSPVQKMLSLTGIDLSIRVFATREEAVAWLGSERVHDATPASLDASTNGGLSTAP